ncbi:hypothetical protein [Longimicrobium sp.]|uniref:hypothetical protein n=1 Tax=Longimicrobium sp. TaxID=2029185 RepID=UPI002CD39FB4|nr:hypothetical protein [Longimicrobium sp.]HSU17659.1 hypothetical protein [Longimicrobium sp.]
MRAPNLRHLAGFALLLLPAFLAASPARVYAGSARADGFVAPQLPVPASGSPSPRARAERLFSACLAQESGPVQVFGMIDDETGDTLAVLRGNRVALRTAYPAVPNAAAARWFAQGERMQLNGVTYVKYSAPRELAPGTVGPFARYAGVPVYAAVGAARPGAVFVALDGCRFQEFRPRAQTRG